MTRLEKLEQNIKTLQRDLKCCKREEVICLNTATPAFTPEDILNPTTDEVQAWVEANLTTCQQNGGTHISYFLPAYNEDTEINLEVTVDPLAETIITSFIVNGDELIVDPITVIDSDPLFVYTDELLLLFAAWLLLHPEVEATFDDTDLVNGNITITDIFSDLTITIGYTYDGDPLETTDTVLMTEAVGTCEDPLFVWVLSQDGNITRIEYNQINYIDSFANFPAIGIEEVLYVDLSTGDIYIWDGIAYSTADGAVDHGSLTGLGDDDHTQYALLAGRATGQTINGGTAANEDITINGTAHATKTTSYVLLQPTGGNVGIGTTTPQNNFQTQGSGEVFLQSTTTSVSKAGFFFNYNNLSYAGMKLYYNVPDANIYFDNLYQADALNNFGDTIFRTTPNIIGTQETFMILKGSGGLLSKKLVEANTAGSGSPNIIIKTESGTVFTNEGTAALNYHTLPTAVAGLTYTFYVDDVDGIRVVVNTGDIIQLNGVASSVAGYCESLVIGSSVTLTAINATDWVAISSLGTWTLA